MSLRSRSATAAALACAAFAAAPVHVHASESWLCTRGAERPGNYSEDVWGAECVSPDGISYGQIQGYSDYNSTNGDATYLWFYVYHGECDGRVYCSATVMPPGGAPTQLQRYEGSHTHTYPFIVASMEISCFCVTDD